MKTLSTILKVLGHVWMGLFAVIWAVSIISMFISLGWEQVANTLSPYNIANWLVTILCALPGVGFYKTSEYCAKRAKEVPDSITTEGAL